MYKEHFRLKELPFSIAPDPRYFYMSNQHREALAHLIYGLNTDGGFILITGEVGTGKSTVCRCLLEEIPQNINIALVLNPKLTVEELLATICDELCISYPKGNSSIKVFIDLLNTYLLDAHARRRKTVLIIEEAQNLTIDVLEQVRLLTNLETNRKKLLQIILLGQPELKNMLSRPELRQLSQRITARYHIGPLSKQEVSAYVRHRLAVAGAHNKLFLPSTIGRLFRLSRGIPLIINLLCDRALLGAYVQGRYRVDRSTLNKAAREIFGNTGVQADVKKSFMNIRGIFAAGKTIATKLFIPHDRKPIIKGMVKGATKTPLSTTQNSLSIKPAVTVKRSEDKPYPVQMKNERVVIRPDNFKNIKNERRRHRRFIVKGNQKTLPHSSYLRIVNISVGGVAIETTKKLEINKEYNLKLRYKGNPMELKGRVVWAAPILVGEKEPDYVIPAYKAGMEFLSRA